jgi:tetratricopeptide (TPR) repeat protein
MKITLSNILLSLIFSHVLVAFSQSESFKTKEAFSFYKQAEMESFQGQKGLKKALEFYNKADQAEPNNPIILSDRGLFKFDSQLDVDGAFEDLRKGIELSTNKTLLQIRYLNRGLCFMGIHDIESACEDWKKAGKDGANYLKKYCNYKSNEPFNKNPDDKIELKLSLIDKKAKIISKHNPAEMSNCNAKITLQNNGDETIEIDGGSLFFGLEKDDFSLYLEAEFNGKRFIFFSSGEFEIYGPNKVTFVKKKESVTNEISITEQHHFPYLGIYKIRVVLRPSKQTKGINQTYYSNWEKLEIVK